MRHYSNIRKFQLKSSKNEFDKNLLVLYCFTIVLTFTYLPAQTSFLLDRNELYTPAPYGQTLPYVTSDSANMLVTWTDFRFGVSNDTLHIFASRINSNGIVVDTSGIPVSIVINEIAWVPEAPHASYGDSIYLIVWADYRNDNWDIYGSRIDTEGNVLDINGFIISAIPTLQYFPAVAFGGNIFLVVWCDGSGIFGCRIKSDGQVLDPNGFPISTNAPGQFSPSVISDGLNFFIVWQDPRGSGLYDIYGVRVDTAGNVLDTTDIHISSAGNSQENPSITFCNSQYFVVWQDSRNGSFDIWGARIDTSGIVIDTIGFVISSANNIQEKPIITTSDTYLCVGWLDWRNNHPEIYCARLTSSGILIDTAGIYISASANDSYSPGLVYNNNFFIVWPDDRSLCNHIYGAQMDMSGNVLDPNGILISRSLYGQWNSSLVFDGQNYFAVWQDYRDDEFSNIFGARIDTVGTVLDSSGIAICTTSYSFSPAVSYGSSNYLVVWTGMSCVRIDTSGVVLDSIISLGTGYKPSVAFDGTNYCIVFTRDDNLYGIRIDPMGTIIDTFSFVVCSQNDRQENSSLIYHDSNYFTVWQDSRNDMEDIYNIYGTFIDTSGFSYDTLGFPISSTVGVNEYNPSVSSNGQGFLVIWQDNRDGDYNIYGARVSETGTVIDTTGIPICTAPSDQGNPIASFNGEAYYIFWEDRRDGFFTDINGCCLDTNGTVIDSFSVATQQYHQLEPSMARDSKKYLIIYTGFVDTIGITDANTMRIWGKFHPFVGVKEDTRLNNNETNFLLNLFPNPTFRKSTLEFSIPKQEMATISLYDINGRFIQNILTSDLTASDNKIIMDFSKFSCGVYFIVLKAKQYSIIKKAVVLK